MPSWLRGLIPLAAALLAGCGGGDDDTSVTIISNPGTGSAVIIVTDAPAEQFAQIWLTVTRVELVGAGGAFTLFEGRRVFDLLSLRDDALLLALGRDVPAGEWSKIRLHVEDVELVWLPEQGELLEAEVAAVGGHGQIELSPSGPIRVRAGELVFVQLDLDAARSVHVDESGTPRVQFRPVATADAFALAAPPRLVRLEGTVDEIDLAAQRLVLCGTHRAFRAEAREDRRARSRCSEVRVGPDTAIFAAHGAPAELADLARGDELAALGRFRVGPGEALVLDASWLHQGGFDAGVAIAGVIVEGATGGELVVAPDRGEPIGAGERVVRLADGAAVFTREGEPLAPAGLVPGLRVRAFGALAHSGAEPDPLDASLVLAHADEALARVRGTVTGTFDAADGTLALRASTDAFAGPLCVAVGPGATVVRTVDEGDRLRTERIEPSALVVGEAVTAFGRPGPQCFDAAALVSTGAARS